MAGRAYRVTEVEVWRIPADKNDATAGEWALFVDPAKITGVSKNAEITEKIGAGPWRESTATGYHFLTLSFVKDYQPQWRLVEVEQGNDDPVPPHVLSDILLLVNVTVSASEIATWSAEQVQAAADWASAVHLSASDNDDVVVPPKPEFLP